MFLGCPLFLTGSPGGLCRSGQARLVETLLDSSHGPGAPTPLLPTSDFLDAGQLSRHPLGLLGPWTLSAPSHSVSRLLQTVRSSCL